MTTSQAALGDVPSADTTGGTSLAAFARGPVAVVAVAFGALLTALSGRYGFHRDELYFLVAGRHLSWGYIDQPPLTPALARLSTALFGDTLPGLRVVAMLAGVAGVVLVALIAREFGGGRRAQVFAACCAAGSSFVLATGHMVSTATFDVVVWLLVSWLVLRLLRTGDTRWYLAVGAAVGVGLLNKDLVAVLAVGLVVAILAVGPRAPLRSPWLFAGGALAVLLALPNLWWQARHGWPELTVAGRIAERDGTENRVMFLPLQLVLTSPLFVPIWWAGLRRLWRDPRVRWARAFVVAYPLLILVMLALAGKAYYVLPLLIVLMAAGAEPVLGWARTAGRRRFVVAWLLVSILVNVVASLPVLPLRALNVVNAMNKEQGEQAGWPQLVRTVADVWAAIPAGQRAQAVILTGNYGEAGAIERYRDAYGLPRPYSGHMSYADWGPPPDSATGPVLLVHFPDDPRLGHFTGCRVAAHVDNGFGLDNDEQGNIVELCTGTDLPWSRIWGDIRHV